VWALILGGFALTVVWQRWGLWIVVGALVAVLVGLCGWMLLGLLTSPRYLWPCWPRSRIGNRLKAATVRSLRSRF